MGLKEPITGLVDADIVAYEYSSTGEVKVDWDGDGEVEQYAVDPKVLESRIDGTLARLTQTIKANELIICLTDTVNFRTSVLPSYKMNRKGMMKPLHLAYAKEYMATNYRTYIKPTLEADDVMGILATHPTLIKGKKIICSSDKDMKTIPAWLHNPNKHPKPRLVPALEAMLFHMEQTLTGDPTDGYTGCVGIGKVKALRALQGCKTYAEAWLQVWTLYESKGLTKEDALVQARVARICQWQDYDYKNNEVILWKEPQL
jgi:DNA polymerase-1